MRAHKIMAIRPRHLWVEGCKLILLAGLMLVVSSCNQSSGKSNGSNSGSDVPRQTDSAGNSGYAKASFGGGLEEATVELFNSDDTLKNQPPLCTTETLSRQATNVLGNNGLFQFPLNCVDRNKMYVVRVSDGRAPDLNLDGVVDSFTTPILGQVHGIVSGEQLIQGQWNVSLLSEMAYQMSRETLAITNDITRSSLLKTRLSALAQHLLKQDINNDLKLDYLDLLAWDESLHFDTLTVNAESFNLVKNELIKNDQTLPETINRLFRRTLLDDRHTKLELGYGAVHASVNSQQYMYVLTDNLLLGFDLTAPSLEPFATWPLPSNLVSTVDALTNKPHMMARNGWIYIAANGQLTAIQVGQRGEIRNVPANLMNVAGFPEQIDQSAEHARGWFITQSNRLWSLEIDDSTPNQATLTASLITNNTIDDLLVYGASVFLSHSNELVSYPLNITLSEITSSQASHRYTFLEPANTSYGSHLAGDASSVYLSHGNRLEQLSFSVNTGFSLLDNLALDTPVGDLMIQDGLLYAYMTPENTLMVLEANQRLSQRPQQSIQHFLIKNSSNELLLPALHASNQRAAVIRPNGEMYLYNISNMQDLTNIEYMALNTPNLEPNTTISADEGLFVISSVQAPDTEVADDIQLSTVNFQFEANFNQVNQPVLESIRDVDDMTLFEDNVFLSRLNEQGQRGLDIINLNSPLPESITELSAAHCSESVVDPQERVLIAACESSLFSNQWFLWYQPLDTLNTAQGTTIPLYGQPTSLLVHNNFTYFLSKGSVYEVDLNDQRGRQFATAKRHFTSAHTPLSFHVKDDFLFLLSRSKTSGYMIESIELETGFIKAQRPIELNASRITGGMLQVNEQLYIGNNNGLSVIDISDPLRIFITAEYQGLPQINSMAYDPPWLYLTSQAPADVVRLQVN